MSDESDGMSHGKNANMQSEAIVRPEVEGRSFWTGDSKCDCGTACMKQERCVLFLLGTV